MKRRLRWLIGTIDGYLVWERADNWGKAVLFLMGFGQHNMAG